MKKIYIAPVCTIYDNCAACVICTSGQEYETIPGGGDIPKPGTGGFTGEAPSLRGQDWDNYEM